MSHTAHKIAASRVVRRGQRIQVIGSAGSQQLTMTFAAGSFARSVQLIKLQ